MPLLGRRETPSRLGLHASPVRDARVGASRGGMGALPLVFDSADHSGIGPGRAGMALGPTPAESRIAVALVQLVASLADLTGRAGLSRSGGTPVNPPPADA